MMAQTEKVGDKYFETLKFPVKLKNGATGVGAFIRDITEQIISQEAVIAKTKDIKRFNDLMIDRELKMIELKKETNELLRAAGKKEKYRIVE
jgi:hypothetical protein